MSAVVGRPQAPTHAPKEAQPGQGGVKRFAKGASKMYGGRLRFEVVSKTSKLAQAANLKSCVYKVYNASPRLAAMAEAETGRFTVCVFKHVTRKRKHFKLLACFKAGQSTECEMFAFGKEGLINYDSPKTFPDLTANGSYTFESKHNAILSAPSLFLSGEDLRNSAESLVMLYAQDEKRIRSFHQRDDVERDLISWIRQQAKEDGGFFRKPRESDDCVTVEFQRPGSDIMQRTGIATDFYMFFDLDDKFDMFKQSDSVVNVLPLKFVGEDGDEWIVLACFGDRNTQMAEVNVIDMETRSLLMRDDEKDFPDLQFGKFVEMIPGDKILKSGNRFVAHENLKSKIEGLAEAMLMALRIVEKEQK